MASRRRGGNFFLFLLLCFLLIFFVFLAEYRSLLRLESAVTSQEEKLYQCSQERAQAARILLENTEFAKDDTIKEVLSRFAFADSVEELEEVNRDLKFAFMPILEKLQQEADFEEKILNYREQGRSLLICGERYNNAVLAYNIKLSQIPAKYIRRFTDRESRQYFFYREELL